MEETNQIILLHSNKKRQAKQIFLYLRNNKYFYLNSDSFKPRDQRVFMYVLSDEEIKEKNWYINLFDNSIGFASETFIKGLKTNCKKIIASTDIELGLPTINDNIIKKILNNYNEKKIIDNVIVQYENKQIQVSTGWQVIHIPKINSEDNSLVLEIKITWTEEQKVEIERLIRKFTDDFNFATNGELKNWLENNLK